MATISVRYIVDDVDEAIAFYTDRLGFTEVMHPAPTFAMLNKDELRLAVSAPGGPGRRRAGDARRHGAPARRVEPLHAGGRGPRADG